MAEVCRGRAGNTENVVIIDRKYLLILNPVLEMFSLFDLCKFRGILVSAVSSLWAVAVLWHLDRCCGILIAAVYA